MPDQPPSSRDRSSQRNLRNFVPGVAAPFAPALILIAHVLSTGRSLKAQPVEPRELGSNLRSVDAEKVQEQVCLEEPGKVGPVGDKVAQWEAAARRLVDSGEWTEAGRIMKLLAAAEPDRPYLVNTLARRKKEAEASELRQDFSNAVLIWNWIMELQPADAIAKRRDACQAMRDGFQALREGEQAQSEGRIAVAFAAYSRARQVPDLASAAAARTESLLLELRAPQHPSPGQVWTDRASGMDFCWVPAGGFDMGSPDTGEGWSPAEGPVHRVTFLAGFWMGRTEVTQAQWKTVMQGNPSSFQGNIRRPVEQVSWLAVKAYLRAIDERAGGNTYRLPSEAEWEYACRAGSPGPTQERLDAVAWWSGNSGRTTHPVSQKQANAWGLQDMLGNVWEWCEDRWHEDYSGAPVDGSAWTNGADAARVVRGGSWNSAAGISRAAFRYSADPAQPHRMFGFRVICVPAKAR